MTNIIDITGKNTGTIDLPKDIFAAKINTANLAQYIRVYLSRQRSAAAKAKTRSEVTGSNAKIWRQKGTGNARHGSRKAPIFVGGGVSHGPTGGQNYKLQISKRQKKQALFAALTTKVSDSLFVSGFEKLTAKTSDLVKIVKTLAKDSRKTLIIIDKPIKNIIAAGANAKGITITQATRLNPYELLNNNTIIFAKEAVDTIANTYVTAKTKSEPKKETPVETTKTAKTTKTTKPAAKVVKSVKPVKKAVKK